MKKIATRLGRVNEDSATGTQYLWNMNPPLVDDGKKFQFVVSSATVAMFSGPETYIFGADSHGEITHWSELPGSYRGGLDHEQAIEGAGYEVEIEK